jgi:hypothetical protein
LATGPSIDRVSVPEIVRAGPLIAADEVVEVMEEEKESSVDLVLDKAEVGIVIARPLCLGTDDPCLDCMSYLSGKKWLFI